MSQQGTSTPGGASAANPMPGRSAADPRVHTPSKADEQARISPPLPVVGPDTEETLPPCPTGQDEAEAAARSTGA